VRGFNRFVILLAVIAIGCGGSPTAPTPTPSAMLASLTISPQTGLVLLGRSQRFTANAVYTDGSSRGVTATWTVTPADAGAIDGSGSFTPHRPGSATIAASFEGRTASVPIRLLPDFSGDWEGVARITECTALLPNSCDELTYAGAERRMALWMDQIEARVRAFLYVDQTGELFVEGTIGDDGSLTLAGERWTSPPLPRYVVLRIGTWSTRIDAADALAGGFTVLSQESPAPDINNPSKRRVYRLLDVRRTRPGR
jgi:hypothetical protein